MDDSELTLDPGFLARLVFKMRAVSLGDEDTPRDARDSAIRGGRHHITLTEEVGGGASRKEVVAEINSMDVDHQQELVALMWVGRDNFSADEWQEALDLAAQRADSRTASYLLSHPMAADEIAAGLEALGHDHILQDGAY